MAKQIVAKWRQSASIIILAKDKLPKSKFDYKVLLFNRNEKATFMPNSSVFPGGVHEKTDGSTQWLRYFQDFGLPKEKLAELTNRGHVSPVKISTATDDEQSTAINRIISMRITAIRETFEEIGILLCRDHQTLSDSSGYGNFCESFDRAHWQHEVHNDSTKFFTLCQELQIVPDLWGLNEWSAWLTPSTFKKRFETTFYLMALQKLPQTLLEESEGSGFEWKSPYDYILDYFNGKTFLPPPQFYELSRLLNFTELHELQKFAHSRANKYGIVLTLPVQYKCTNGNVSIFPGDENYPANPHASNEPIKTGISMQEFRANVQKLHRVEYEDLNNATLHLNFTPEDGQLRPLCMKQIAKL